MKDKYSQKNHLNADILGITFSTFFFPISLKIHFFFFKNVAYFPFQIQARVFSNVLLRHPKGYEKLPKDEEKQKNFILKFIKEVEFSSINTTNENN